MLILGRRINQSIVFPNCGITVRLLDINGKVAKIGIEAPRSVEILRGELTLASHPLGRGGDEQGSQRYTVEQAYEQPSQQTSRQYAEQSRDYNSEQIDAPESSQSVLQFAQRLAEIRAGLHLFQQRRAAGDEIGADLVFGDLLNELSALDTDSLKSVCDRGVVSGKNRAETVREGLQRYERAAEAAPIQILVVNDSDNLSGFPIPAGMFHGCQVCTVNSRQTALDAIASSEPLDYVVCNGSARAFDELDLVRTIREDRRLDTTKIFMASVSESALEHFELSGTYRIDGWLARPLQPHDLWKHIVESQQFEF